LLTVDDQVSVEAVTQTVVVSIDADVGTVIVTVTTSVTNEL